MREVTFRILFEGAFDGCYLTGDNSAILPTGEKPAISFVPPLTRQASACRYNQEHRVCVGPHP